MKRLIIWTALTAALPAFADPNSIVLTQRNSTDTGNVTRVMATPSGPAFLSYDTTTSLPVYLVLGTGFSVSSGTLNAVGAAPAWSAITGKPTFAPIATTGAWSDLTGTPTTLSGYGITDGATSSALSAGLAGKFNTPTGTTSQYVRGDGTLATLPASSSGTVTSVGVTSSTLTVTGSPVTTSGSITVNTVARSFAYPTRALSTCFQISSTRDAQVTYGVDISTTVTLGGSPQGTVFLRTYTNNTCTTGQQTIISSTAGQPTTLSVTVGQTMIGTANLSGMIPAGTWVQIETQNNSGTPTFTTRQGEEVLL
jgi:hypothetical protein